MPLTIVEHALAAHLVTRLRDETTPPERFRPLTRALTHVLMVEATRHLPTRSISVQTPLERTDGQALDAELVLVPVLRAGLGMLDPALEMLQEVSVGYVGLERDESTAVAHSYYVKLPPLTGKTALLLDPMLATGGSAAWAAGSLYMAGATHVILLCVVAAPTGVERLAREYSDLHVIAAALDRELNDRSYILPGLGDFGDRLYGTF